MNGILKISNSSDSELTARAVAGQLDAFAQIVSRYQSLVCSLAYSATGSLSQSEDLAQETFIAAWKGLQTLREPEKLRSWLCGIARNIIANAVRHGMREPEHAAQPLDTVVSLPSPESLPVDRAISSEEESILWRSLEHIPQIYREPLVLFYRQGQSVESVAQELELSEEAVKQRLSRGRKLLKMEVEAFVETALRQSAPGREFTSAVLAGLPVLSVSASGSSIGVVASKGLATAKTGFFTTFIAGMLSPILGALGGFLSLVGTVKSARSAREKALWMKSAVIFLCIFAIGQAAFFWFRNEERLSILIWIVQFVACVFVILTAGILVRRLRKRIQIEEGRVQERRDPKLPFGRPESRGFKWNMYGGLFGLTFCNPFAMLTVWAAAARDSIALFAMLAILAATLMFSRRIIIQKPEQTLNIWRVIMIIQFPLLLAVIHLRWETWTGKSPWQFHSDALLPVAMGFLLFAFFTIQWLAERNR
jgi:RNA polymerase sigma factor (sigma-70 family)